MTAPPSLDRDTPLKTAIFFVHPQKIFILLALLYAVGAILSGWNIIAHTQASTRVIEQILTTYNMKNEGAQALERYSEEHPLLGMFLASPIRHELDLPSHEA